MTRIALIYVIGTALIETAAFGWMLVEFWPDSVLVPTVVGALAVCLVVTYATGQILDHRLRAIFSDGHKPTEKKRRPVAVERM